VHADLYIEHGLSSNCSTARYGLHVKQEHQGAVQDARRNASRNGIDNATFGAVDLTTTMPQIDIDLPQPDVVIVGVASPLIGICITFTELPRCMAAAGAVGCTGAHSPCVFRCESSHVAVSTLETCLQKRRSKLW
jgi:hypothetical protein